jgi:phage gpG-like protein
MLPRVKIDFKNGSLGNVAPKADGVCGLAITGSPVADKFALLTPYILHQLEGLADLGITSAEDDDNAFIYKHVKEFYAEAKEGAELWLMGFSNATLPSAICDNTQNNAKKLLQLANGKLRCLAVAFNPASAEGEEELPLAMLNAHQLAEWTTENLYAPLFILLEGRNFTKENVATLADLSQYDYNRVGVLIGDTVSESAGAAVGLLLGRIAAIPVQRHIGRVRDGAVAALNIFIDDQDPAIANVETINDKGYITFRTFTGKAGYFFSDDNLATEVSDDYRSIARRRSIDKAYRIIYQTMLERINDEIPVNATGGIPAAIAKAWEADIVSAVVNQMGANGELGNDPDNANDKGVKAYINPEQNVVATSQFKVQAQIKPFGYAKYIDVELGEMFDKNFERKAFFTQAWTPRKREDKGTLLLRTGKLRRSIRKEISGDSIRFTSSESYTAIHNEGGVLMVTKKMKKFFWAKYLEASGKVRTIKKGTSAKSKSNLRISAAAQAWKYMAMMREGSKIKIPQRQFIGDAPEVRIAVEKIFNEKLKVLEPEIKKYLTPKHSK